MPDLHLSNGNDDYTQPSSEKDNGVNIFGEAGDDIIRSYGGNVLGGKGNDTIQFIPTPGQTWRQLIAAYWDGAPGKVVVDLLGGWAQDGWGTRDTLIGVEAVAGGGSEVELYGTNNDNSFWITTAKNTVDGRGGFDVLNLPWFSNTAPSWSDFNIKVSVDGKSAVLSSPKSTSFSATISNVEALSIWDGKVSTQRSLSDFVTVQDLAIGGLVQGNVNRWNAASPVGTAVEVSFSFVAKAPGSGVGANQFRVFTTTEKEVVRKILQDLTSFTGLSFKEVDESSGTVGSMRFGVSQQTVTKGTSNFPGEAGDAAGDVWMDIESMLNLAPGSEGYAALLHEIGHALGLRHPSNVDASDHYVQEILPAYNQTTYTVMSQNFSSDGLFPSTWGNMDISALRYLYGNKALNIGNSTLVLSDAQARSQSSLVDDGGVDTLDASGSKVGVSIDLQPGHLSSFGVTANGIPAVNNLSLAIGTVIENVIGSNGDDYLLGNDADNRITGNYGNDWIDGGNGIDTAVFSSPRSNYFISTAFGKTFVSSRDGSGGFDTLLNIEKLQFSDGTMNLTSKALGADAEVVVDLGNTLNANLPVSSDLDSSNATYQLLKGPTIGVASIKPNGEFTYLAKPGAVADSFSYTLSDGKGNSNVYTVFVQINADVQALNGSAANDQLNGSEVNDLINGMGGDDQLSGAGGNDIVEGGNGIDTAIYRGKLMDYRVKIFGDIYQVYSKTGVDGTDTLSHVEKLQFSDMTVNLMVQSLAATAPTANVQRLMELYVAFFNRVPDADGMAYWIGEMQSGRSINQIADIFYGAGVQFSSLTGFTATMTNTDFINVIYKNVLGRADGADAGGLNYWNAELTSGRASRGSLVSTILDAAHIFKGDSTWGWVANLLDNKITVAKAFSVDWGLGYAIPDDAIKHGMEIAAAVTPTDTSAALNLIGINGADLALF
ncbi:DUF4214 domain-containing protein [Undibacterium sp. LX40W]|uniref:DUF4214 domain-containing protein n=1 Tax=Undibacterium nitidum TaxID=2762298 RepID=A0A923KTB4_9BURK|nr:MULTISPECIES: DUF4214 domain-containing protein [Undibacterium]MBC3881384.1 DUF4214 domain-containing protein [Undibacterium nitidum]MBC3891833.1 DUF4214 domain-containing protein [Undibacterium sp. LX40W]